MRRAVGLQRGGEPLLWAKTQTEHFEHNWLRTAAGAAAPLLLHSSLLPLPTDVPLLAAATAGFATAPLFSFLLPRWAS